MAEVTSPISGGLRVARRTVSADSFVRAAPPPPPLISQPDPITTSLIQRNSLALNTVSEQLSSLSQQVNSLNAAMQNVYGNITQSAALERRKDAQEQEQERRLAEQQLREGKESAIERKIQNALVYPVQKISEKTSFTLSRVMRFFTTILGGWLLKEGLETIKALGEGNRDRLIEIRDNVLKNLGVVGGIYAGIRFGLTSLFNVMTRVAARITTAVAIGLFVRPVQALLDGVKGAANKLIPKIQNNLPSSSGGKGGSGGGTPSGGTPSGGKPDGKEPPKGPARTPGEASKRVGQKGANRFSPTSLLGPIIGGLTGGTIDTMQGEDPAKAYTSNLGGAAVASYAAGLVSKLPLPPIIKIPATLATGFFSYGPATDMLKGFYESGEKMFTGGSDTEPVNTSVQPTQNKIPDIAFNSNTEDLSNRNRNQESNELTSENVAPLEKEQDFSKPPEYGTIEAETLIAQNSQLSDLSIDANKTASEDKLMTSDTSENKTMEGEIAKIEFSVDQNKLSPFEIASSADNRNLIGETKYPEISRNTEKIESVLAPTPPQPLKIDQVKTTPVKQEANIKAENVGPLPEPSPKFLPLPLNGMGTGMSSKKLPTITGESTTSVPNIDPENPNNFYVVFSHSVYNVPMM